MLASVRITERISIRATHLEILSSFDFNTISSIMQSDNQSASVSVNRMITTEALSIFQSFVDDDITAQITASDGAER